MSRQKVWEKFKMSMTRIKIDKSEIFFFRPNITKSSMSRCVLGNNVGTKKNKNMYGIVNKVHIFWEGHKILRNVHRRFDCYYFANLHHMLIFCELSRLLQEFYILSTQVLFWKSWVFKLEYLSIGKPMNHKMYLYLLDNFVERRCQHYITF